LAQRASLSRRADLARFARCENRCGFFLCQHSIHSRGDSCAHSKREIKSVKENIFLFVSVLCNIVLQNSYVLLLDMSVVADVDFSALGQLQATMKWMRQHEIHVMATAINGQVRDVLRKSGFLSLIGEENVYWTHADAVRAARFDLFFSCLCFFLFSFLENLSSNNTCQPPIWITRKQQMCWSDNSVTLEETPKRCISKKSRKKKLASSNA
jgi:hypothetical protein